MSANVNHERKWVGELYPGRNWKKRVSKMDDKQVLAIYIREHQKAQPKKKPQERKPDAEPF